MTAAVADAIHVPARPDARCGVTIATGVAAPRKPLDAET